MPKQQSEQHKEITIMVLRFEVNFYYKTDCLKGTTQDVGNNEKRGKKTQKQTSHALFKVIFDVLCYFTLRCGGG